MEQDQHTGPIDPETAVEALQDQLREASRQYAREQDRLFSELLSKLAGPSRNGEGAPVAGQSNRQAAEAPAAKTQEAEMIWQAPPDAEDAPARAGTMRPQPTVVSNLSMLMPDADPESMEWARSLTKPMPEFKLAGLSGPEAKKSFADHLDAKLSFKRTRCQKCFQSLVQVCRFFETLEEPARTGPVAKFVRSKLFITACVLCIGLNAIFITYTTDFEIQNPVSYPDLSMAYIELGFMAFYTVELTLKLYVHRAHFFCNSDMGWNIFDVFLVAFSIFDVAIVFMTRESTGSSATMNLSFLRSVRVFKVAKALRTFRALGFFAELRLMLDCVLGSFVSLFWCLLMLLFILYVFALLIVQGITLELQEADEGPLTDALRMAVLHFGSVGQAMLTLLQSTTSGLDWAEVYKALYELGGYLPVVYVFFILFFVIAAWNIVTSTFVDKALRLAQPDLETLTRDQLVKDFADAEELMNLFSEEKVKHTSSISMGEFVALAEHSKFRTYLNVRGIDIKNAEVFFRMLQTIGGRKNVELGILVSTLIRMKGFATSIDLHSLGFETKMLGRKQRAFMEESRQRLMRIEELNFRLLKEMTLTPTLTLSSTQL